MGKLFKRRKKTILYNPMELTEELKKLGESYDRKTTGLYYLVVLFVAVAFGFFFELGIFGILATVLAYFFFVPQLMYNQKKHAYEQRRFADINSYMHQMIQSFTRTKKIRSSLYETRNTFTSGKMHDVLVEAIDIIENDRLPKNADEQMRSDPRAATKVALKLVEKHYGCEKLRILHDFLIKAEERGGECIEEFALLEKEREIWKAAVMKYHDNLKAQRNFGCGTYLFLMGVCIFLMNYMESVGICIMEESITQLVNMAMLILFIIFFVFMDKRLNTNLLKEPVVMSQKKVDTLYSYIQGFDSKKERRKYLSAGILSCVVAAIVVITEPSFTRLFIAAAIVALGFNVHRIQLAYTVKVLKSEMEKEFPKWLFDMLLLLQRESVEGSIFLSTEKAPPILKGELQRISLALQSTPHSADIYMSFLADFGNQNVEETMRTLYSLAVGTGGEKQKVMGVIIDENIVHLARAEEQGMEDKMSYSMFIEYLPSLVATGVLMGYMVVIMSVAFLYLNSMI